MISDNNNWLNLSVNVPNAIALIGDTFQARIGIWKWVSYILGPDLQSIVNLQQKVSYYSSDFQV